MRSLHAVVVPTAKYILGIAKYPEHVAQHANARYAILLAFPTTLWSPASVGPVMSAGKREEFSGDWRLFCRGGDAANTYMSEFCARCLLAFIFSSPYDLY